MTDAELDRWSAEVLMEWKHFSHDIYYGPDGRHQDWHPTSPNTPAWQILACIEKMREKGWSMQIYYGAHEGIDVTFRGIKILKGPLRVINKTYVTEPLLTAILLAAHAAWEKEG